MVREASTGELRAAFLLFKTINTIIAKALFFARQTTNGWEVEEITGPGINSRDPSLAFDPTTDHPMILLPLSSILRRFDGQEWLVEQDVYGNILVIDPLTQRPMAVQAAGIGVLLWQFDGSIWTESTVDPTGSQGGEGPRATSIAIHPETGQIFIAYREEISRNIRVAISNPRANRVSEWVDYE